MGLLRGKRAVVTGGTGGIGREIAKTFVLQGADVYIFGTNSERGEEAVREFLGCRISEEQKVGYHPVNVADKGSIDAGVEAVIAALGGVDILVNNAGITRDGLLMKMSEEDWDLVLDTNLKSVYALCKSVIRGMLKERFGKIINISSVVGLTGNAGQTNYAASKAGMIGFTKALALETASRGICVNCIAPGFIQTRMTDVLTEGQKQSILGTIPMGKLGRCEDIAGAALFLAGPHSDYITGQVLTVDGGMVM